MEFFSKLTLSEKLYWSQMVQFNCDSGTSIRLYDVIQYQNALWC